MVPVVLLGLLAVARAEPEMIPVEALEVVGQTASTFELPLREGGTFELASHRGRVVVVSFWASWCGPCRLELPALSALAATRADVTFVAVNVDRQRADAEKFLRAVPVTVPVAFDNESLALGDFSVMSMPTTFVIDAEGVVRHRKVGFSQERGLTELIGYIDGVQR
jgi:thiol-disulfide isomerase/thioredoxin